jgi:hypothetical protein
MKSKDQTLLEEAYRTICEQDSLPKSSEGDPVKTKIENYIKRYINNGSQGDLNLSDHPVTSLPSGLKVGRHLYLMNTQITELPQGIQLGGALYLDGSKITSLPKNLIVKGTLSLKNTPIKVLPPGLRVHGDLYLRNTGIQELPDDLFVRDSLYIENTPLGKPYTDNNKYKGHEDGQIAAKKDLTTSSSFMSRLMGSGPEIGGTVFVGNWAR